MQPQSYQQARVTPYKFVRSRQWRMSNLRSLQRNGRSMYIWTMQVFQLGKAEFWSLRGLFVFYDYLMMLLSSQISSMTVIPLPWFEFSPGLTIQIFLVLDVSPQLCSYSLMSLALRSQNQTKRLYYLSLKPCLMWKVRGMQQKTSSPIFLQYYWRLQKRAFLLPK